MSHRQFPRRTALWLAGLVLFLTASAAAAHGGRADFDDDVWNVWAFEPGVMIPLALTSLIYVACVMRRRATQGTLQLWRHASFAGGMAALFLALESPADYVAEHLFMAHQVQHMLLRMIAPMLIALSAPQAMMISGLPSGLRRSALMPLMGNGVLRAMFSWLTGPIVLTVLFLAALYVWQVPAYHDAALLDDNIHDTMHVTMLIAGLLFWWRIFDTRPAPASLAYGTRLMMLWIVILSNIGLGAYSTLKSDLLYPAYDTVGRLFDIAPLTDEMVGGFIIWVPSSMMCLIAVLIVIHMWGRHETRADDKRRTSPAHAALYPTTGAQLREQARTKNNGLAIGIAAFMASVFAAAIFAGVLSHLNTERHGLFAPVEAAQHRALH
ncbi:MAG: cytochrome c oxidase assembly protein [Pseudolabrys sp.]|nr:cytochrome c oxidase assembly protein [Pseudolabrys sp.]